MMYTFLTAATLVLALLGLTEFIRGLCLFILAPKSRAKTFSVICLSEDSARQQVKYALEQYHWAGKGYADCVIAVTDALSGETAEKCRALDSYGRVVFCPLAALGDMVESLSKT